MPECPISGNWTSLSQLRELVYTENFSMHSRRLCTLLLGAWLAGGLFMAWVAVHNQRSPQQLLKSNSKRVQEELYSIGPNRAASLFQFQVSELNRELFDRWELTQIALALALGITLLFSTNGNRLMMALWGLMFALVLIQHLTITPMMIELGRGVDFAGIDEFIEERRAFRRSHASYGWLEVVKGLAGLGLAVRLLFSNSSGARRRRRREVDPIDHPDHSHVNG
jgi:hypothetical protein